MLTLVLSSCYRPALEDFPARGISYYGGTFLTPVLGQPGIIARRE